MARPTEPRWQINWLLPGEIVAVAHIPRDRAAQAGFNEELHAALNASAGGRLHDNASEGRTFVFNAPGEERSLVFSFQRLTERGSSAAVKAVVQTLHRQINAIGGDDVDVIGVMPHFRTRAHEGGGGPSPGTFARPVYPDEIRQGWTRSFYQPVNPNLDLTTKVADFEPVRVAILDVHPDLERAQSRAREFQEKAENRQLAETLQWLQKNALPGDERYEREFNSLEPLYEAQAAALPGEPPPYPVPDHGVFIAGLIHGIAPTAPLCLEPVLDETGVGGLSLLLLGLLRVLENKNKSGANTPQIINLSLGFLPHPTRLPAAWFGLDRPDDPDHQPLEELREDLSMFLQRGSLRRTADLLQSGLHELGRYLSMNNCLVVAAAGNDSLSLVESGQERMQPRLPARFETVLGVAATTSDPRVPAPYSNVGDERELGDHVATFGGGVTQGLQPEDGVISIYSGDFEFDRRNETGWAYWSGTSFATAIVSGIAANYWAYRRKDDPEIHASTILAELHREASTFGPYVPVLRTPSIEVLSRWGR